MARNTSSPTSRYWIMLPSDPLSEEEPSETLLPSAEARVYVIVTPAVTAITTPVRKKAESFSGLRAVTKMMADNICGPAFIVMARGRTCRFMIYPLSVRLPGLADCVPEHSSPRSLPASPLHQASLILLSGPFGDLW